MLWDEVPLIANMTVILILIVIRIIIITEMYNKIIIVVIIIMLSRVVGIARARRMWYSNQTASKVEAEESNTTTTY